MPGAAIGAGITALMGPMSDMAGNLYANAKSSKAARRAFHRAVFMYKNRYQWTMEDMRKAGLNPILAAGQPAAPTGQPQQARVFKPDPGDVGAGARSASKLQSEREILKRQVELLRTGAVKNEEDAFQARSSGELNSWLIGKAQEDTRASKAHWESVRLDNAYKALGLPAAAAQSKLDKTEFGEYMRWVNRIIRSGTGRDQTGAGR